MLIVAACLHRMLLIPTPQQQQLRGSGINSMGAGGQPTVMRQSSVQAATLTFQTIRNAAPSQPTVMRLSSSAKPWECSSASRPRRTAQICRREGCGAMHGDCMFMACTSRLAAGSRVTRHAAAATAAAEAQQAHCACASVRTWEVCACVQCSTVGTHAAAADPPSLPGGRTAARWASLLRWCPARPALQGGATMRAGRAEQRAARWRQAQARAVACGLLGAAAA